MWHIEIDVALHVRRKEHPKGFYRWPMPEEYHFVGPQTFIILRVPWSIGIINEEYYEPFLETDVSEVAPVWERYGHRFCDRMNRTSPPNGKLWKEPAPTVRWSSACST